MVLHFQQMLFCLFSLFLLYHLASCEFMLPLSFSVLLHWLSFNLNFFFSLTIWEGMLMRQNQRSSMKWVVKPLLLINRSRSEKTFMLRLNVSPRVQMKFFCLILKGQVRHKNCLHIQQLLLVRVALILLLAGMANLLTILVRFFL